MFRGSGSGLVDTANGLKTAVGQICRDSNFFFFNENALLKVSGRSIKRLVTYTREGILRVHCIWLHTITVYNIQKLIIWINPQIRCNFYYSTYM